MNVVTLARTISYVLSQYFPWLNLEEFLKLGLNLLIATALIGAATTANAQRQYFLVGVRHVYSLPSMPDVHESDRQQIEEAYAAAIKSAQDQFDAAMASLADLEGKNSTASLDGAQDTLLLKMERASEEAAEVRDSKLKRLYRNADYILGSHPELKLDQDGAYMPMGVETSRNDQFTNTTFYQPYPTFVVPHPFGWNWGTWYPYGSFLSAIRLFHSQWYSLGSPFYGPLSFGGVRFITTAPVRRHVVVNRTLWTMGGPPPLSVRERQDFKRVRQVQVSSGVVPVHPTTPVVTAPISRPATNSPSTIERHEIPVVRSQETAPVTHAPTQISVPAQRPIEIRNVKTPSRAPATRRMSQPLVVPPHPTLRKPPSNPGGNFRPPAQGRQGSNAGWAPPRGGNMPHPIPPIRGKKRGRG